MGAERTADYENDAGEKCENRLEKWGDCRGALNGLERGNGFADEGSPP